MLIHRCRVSTLVCKAIHLNWIELNWFLNCVQPNHSFDIKVILDTCIECIESQVYIDIWFYHRSDSHSQQLLSHVVLNGWIPKLNFDISASVMQIFCQLCTIRIWLCILFFIFFCFSKIESIRYLNFQKMWHNNTISNTNTHSDTLARMHAFGTLTFLL